MESNNTIDLISPLKRLEEATAIRVWRSSNTDFRDGYLMGIRHAIELAEIMQWRLDMRLTQEEQLTK